MTTADNDMRDRFGLPPREIATLPASNHVQALRTFIDRMRRTRAATPLEAARAQESLDALEKAINQQQKGPPT